MAYIETSRPAPFGAVTTLKLVNLFDDAIAAFTAWNLTRKTENTLNKLSDEQLADIGIERRTIKATAMELVIRRNF